MTFREWLDMAFYPDYDPSDLSDPEYYELEDLYEEEELGYVMEDDLW